MSETIDISNGWLLGWMPEPELNTWKQRFGDWKVDGGMLVGESPGAAQIFANIEPEQDHVWETTFEIDSETASLSVIVCFSEARNTYYQICFTPKAAVKANYVMADAFDGVLMDACGPVVEAGVPYTVRVRVEQAGTEITVNDETIGRFSDSRLAGRIPGFMVNHGRARIHEATLKDAATGDVLFSDDFAKDSLRRTAPVELSELHSEEWLPAVIPGTVQTALLEAGKIADPYYGYHGPEQRWVDRQRWIYKTSFAVPDAWADKNIDLIFEGIDYHGYIWLNGELLGYHEGMHLARRFRISDKVRRNGPNELVVCLLPCPTPPHSNIKPYILQRWHFNMDILTAGLWRPVKLRAFESISVIDPQVVTRSLGPEGAVVDIGFTVVSNTMYPFELTGTVRVIPPGADAAEIEEHFSTGYFTGAQRRNVRVTIPNPELWWPNGMGEQPLYTLAIDAQVVERTKGPEPTGTDALRLTFGVRTLEMRPTPENNWKYNWVFTVNGRPFFAKGANWMPVDQMLRLDKDRYETMLLRARDANINMLRPWGAGLVETEEFYDVCDRLGICVWQEFLLANGYYHKFDAEVWRDTIVQNVKRLRNRPSLFMWCGGNEFDPDCPQNKAVVDTLENWCRELDPSRDFHRASPYGGDSHSYQVNWMEGANYTYFTRDLSAAITEFSMASPPNLETLKRLIPEEEFVSWPPVGPDPLEPFEIPGWTPEFRSRESAFSMHDAHLSRALMVMMPFISECGIPADWEDFIEFAQTSHGMLTRFGIDFWRSRWPYCTATMSWVFNVIWPSSMTWEYVDWFGVPKASYYDKKQAYELLHVGAVFDELFTPAGTEFKAKLFAANETTESFDGAAVHVRLYDTALNVLAELRKTVDVAADCSQSLGFFVWNVPRAMPDQALFLRVDLLRPGSGELLSRSVYTPRVGASVMRMPYLKNGPWTCEVRRATTSLELAWAEEWREDGDGWTAALRLANTGGRPTYRARLYCPEADDRLRYSDNHFWLEAGESRTIRLQVKSGPVEEIRAKAWNAAETRPEGG